MNDYFFQVTTDKLKLFMRLTPEERLLWLEEAHEFVKHSVSKDKLTQWKQYLKGGNKDGKSKT